MAKYPEWFIGGPLDGDDKTKTFPNIPDWSVVNGPMLTTLKVGETISWTDPQYMWAYRREMFHLGTVCVYFWTDNRLISREEVASRLGELIMKPHEITEPEPEPQTETAERPMCECGDSHRSGGRCPWPDGFEGKFCPKNNGTFHRFVEARENETRKVDGQ